MSKIIIEYEGQPVDVIELMRHIVNHEVALQYSPWFFTYYADLTGEGYMSKYVRFLRKLLSMRDGGLTGQKVLDAGCGFGIMSTLMALMGAQEIHSFDCHEGMIATFRAYLGILPYKLPVFPRVGDVGAMPYEDESFDLVLSHEAISHYGDVGGFLAESYRVLRPGGALLLSDSNNALNRRVVKETWEIWSAFEEGPATTNVHGHTIAESFREQRAEIIARDFPQLSPDAVTLLAKHTSGLWGDGLKQAVESYMQSGELPGHVYREGTCPIDPVQGYYIEYLFDPYDLKRRLETLGFDVRLRAYLGGARGGALALANDLLTWRPLTRLTLRFARAFRILAIKKRESRATVGSRTCASPC